MTAAAAAIAPIARLKQGAVPALVMHGGKWSPLMRDAAVAISTRIPKAKLLTIDGQTHGVSPKALAPVLEKFFA